MEIIDCSTGECVLYQVQNGETINEISNRFANCKIIRNNPNIDLYDGEIIKVVRQSHKSHIVKPMETLDSIAKQYNLTQEHIMNINNLNSKRLFIGQTLIVENKN